MIDLVSSSINRGDLLFVRRHGFIGWCIRRITSSRYNHVGVINYDYKTGVKTVIEAAFGGVREIPLDKYFQDIERRVCKCAIYRFKVISDAQINGIIDFMSQKIDNKYDYLQLICLALFLLFHITRRIEPIDICDAWICSELVAEASESVGLRLSDKIDSDCITPQDIVTSERIIKVSGD